MSYCVNCGVELDVTATACPLCNTKIYNPNQPPAADVPTPYATLKGHVEQVKARELTILMTIVLITTALVCLFLNIFTIQIGRWSYYVVGVCAMLWILMMPLFFPGKTNIYGQLAFNGLSISLFLALVSWLHPGNQWYPHIGLPLTILGTLLAEIIALITMRLNSSMIVRTMSWVTAIAVFCISVEMSIDLHLRNFYYLRWSAIVATCAFVIDIILMTIYLQKGLRAEIRRRMHF